MDENSMVISKAALSRIPRYLNYLKSLPEDGPVNISSTMIAEELGLNQVLVRKDIAFVGNGGKPKIGYKQSRPDFRYRAFPGLRPRLRRCNRRRGQPWKGINGLRKF